jgi:hypothetical protein
MFRGTPILVVTISPNKKANTDEKSVVAKSQKLEPILLMETNRETKVRCIEM